MELLSGEFRCRGPCDSGYHILDFSGRWYELPCVFRGGPEPWLSHEDHRHVGVHHPCHARERRWVRVSRNGTLTVLTRREAGAVQIGSATYETQAGQLNLTMKDGTNLTMQAGAGVEQWEP